MTSSPRRTQDDDPSSESIGQLPYSSDGVDPQLVSYLPNDLCLPRPRQGMAEVWVPQTQTTLDTIPEEVATLIAEKIRDWAKVDGNLNEREKAARMRDSALSAVAMSCRNLQELYFTILLQDVTLHLDFILSFRSCLIENPDYGNMIKSIHFKGFTSTITDRDVTALQQGLRAVFSRLDTSKDSTVQFAGGVIEVQQFIYENMGCLQTLIVENDMFIPNHFDRVPSFSNSLKKIFIALGDHTRPDPCAPLTAKNVIWILSFGQIEMAALGFSISVFDFSFLHEHAQYFTATSKVKKLALRFSFVFKETDRRTWWGSQSQRNKVVKHTNVKTEAVALILSLVNNLECLEVLCVDQEKFNPGDGATLNLDYLSDLEQSLGSLRHLRLLDSENITAADWPSFQSLYVLSLDGYLLSQLYGSNKPALPVSLETIILSHYDSFDEDLSLIKVIKSHYLPNLKEVILPSETIGPDESGLEDPQTSEELDLWAQRRRDLENEEIFKSGKVRLRQFNWGEVVTSETFMSTLPWISC